MIAAGSASAILTALSRRSGRREGRACSASAATAGVRTVDGVGRASHRFVRIRPPAAPPCHGVPDPRDSAVGDDEVLGHNQRADRPLARPGAAAEPFTTRFPSNGSRTNVRPLRERLALNRWSGEFFAGRYSTALDADELRGVSPALVATGGRRKLSPRRPSSLALHYVRGHLATLVQAPPADRPDLTALGQSY